MYLTEWLRPNHLLLDRFSILEHSYLLMKLTISQTAEFKDWFLPVPSFSRPVAAIPSLGDTYGMLAAPGEGHLRHGPAALRLLELPAGGRLRRGRCGRIQGWFCPLVVLGPPRPTCSGPHRIFSGQRFQTHAGDMAEEDSRRRYAGGQGVPRPSWLVDKYWYHLQSEIGSSALKYRLILE